MTTIPRDQWYVAAYSTEIEQELFSRTICGEPILFWRTRSGAVTAVPDRCVHRRFPLSQAPLRLVEDQVVCGYHGFTYGADGKCVSVPAQIPRAPYLDSPDYTTVRGMEPLKARYSLLVDNLLDLSHETYLHGGYIGTPEVAETPITTEVDDEAGLVYVSRHMADAECPPFYAKSTGLTGRIARWQDIEYTPPCLYKLHSRIAPVGSVPRPDGSDPDAFHVEVTYAITPETEHSTHDFWSVARDFALGDEEVSEFLAENNRTVVLQDVTALDVLERVIQNEPKGYLELSVNIDTGGLAARRMLQRLAAPEQASTARA